MDECCEEPIPQCTFKLVTGVKDSYRAFKMISRARGGEVKPDGETGWCGVNIWYAKLRSAQSKRKRFWLRV